MSKFAEKARGVKLSTPVALLLGCVIGVALMMFIPNPLENTVGGNAYNLGRSQMTEAAAGSRYAALSRQAAAEGEPTLAALFAAASEAESAHAALMLEALGTESTAREAAEEAVRNETNEAQQLYPEYAQLAEHEGDTAAMQAFRYAAAAEETHAALLQDALDAAPGTVVTYYVCPVCGAIFRDAPPKICPVCGTSGTLFMPFSS